MQLLLATQNKGKQREIQEMLADLDIQVLLPEEDFDVEETGKTFEENAFLKARSFSEHFGMMTLADDSGLVVDALDGRPGVYSKRYGSSDEHRNQKLLVEMKGKENRAARFVCVICLHSADISQCFEGKVEGRIAEEVKGADGFGYDPIFIPEGYDKTFAELGTDVKNTMSHRGNALKKVREYLEGRG